MTNTEKILEEFEKNIELIEDLIKVVSDTDVLDSEYFDNYYSYTDRIINGSAIDNARKALGLKGKLKELFTESIAQALAEDRERVKDWARSKKEKLTIKWDEDKAKCKDCGKSMFEVGEIGKSKQIWETKQYLDARGVQDELVGMKEMKLYQCPEDKTIAIY